ncbi:MAG: hypothetical protein F7B20_02665 [Aeropyrum sp.]|nr:hypothetical protein [Aeropyrum sp.]MCE4616868.1 hypothetical protein [Aeropyrum sp.]
MEPKQVVGLILTVVGILLLAYGIISGLQKGVIGSAEGLTTDAASMIIGWFAILIGPALYFGEAPAAIRKKVGG